MNKILTLIIIGFSTLAYGQNFDISDFNNKMRVAEWLCYYDQIAWISSDSVMKQDPDEIKKLGADWFCFQKESTWHAVYGKYENNIYDLVFHFKVDSTGQLTKTNEKVDPLMLNRFSKALQLANSQLTELRDSIHLRFNQYIRQNEDQTINVWILPAFQPNSVAVYGGEFVYTIDAAATKIIDDHSYFQGEFRGYKIDKDAEIWLNYQELDKPTLGTIFFAWYYKSYFTKIVINNSKSISTPIESDKSWTWIHAMKEVDKKRKRRNR